MPPCPTWNVPENISEILANEDGMWEDERWAPLQLTAMSGTEFEGRAIPIAWQIEFDPSDEEFEAANERLEERDLESDGYGWGESIQKIVKKSNSALAKRLHLNDCEADTCVIWVESEADCQALIEIVWRAIFKH